MKIMTVSEVNGYTKALLDEDMLLSDVYVSGEISNLKRHTSGHMYFSLKDEKGQISAAMFKWQCQYLRFAPANGMRVVAHGKITLYEAGGQYQLVASSLQPDGMGALYAAYEKLKAQLETEGLFEQSRKRPLPEMPMRVGVVTSKSGAAVRDIINIITRRWPLCQIVLAPVMVQGEAAPFQISRAVREMNRRAACDVMIVGRGGGSIEDLWAFNDEMVVRAVVDSAIPVISAVGHETDFTLCDFAADLRAPTPSAAAELAVPEAEALSESITGMIVRMRSGVEFRFRLLSDRLDAVLSRRCISDPVCLYEARVQRLYMAVAAVNSSMSGTLAASRERFAAVSARLAALNPLAVLGRGYSVLSRAGHIISTINDIEENDIIDIKLADGAASARVLEKQEDHYEEKADI